MSKSKSKGLIFLPILIAVLVSAFVWYSQNNTAEKPAQNTANPITSAEMQVDFIDVGQGDSILLRVGDRYALIDAGDTSEQYVVRDYLIENGINHLDFMIATHAHDDHIGGGANVLAAVGCSNVYTPDLPEKHIPTTKVFTNFINMITTRSVSQEHLIAGDNFSLGNAKISVVAPSRNTLDSALGNGLNNSSIAVLVTFGTFDVFFGGDMEKQSEKNVLEEQRNISCEVAKLSHHGSNTSNTKDFLSALGADDYVISVGMGNSYNHPAKQVLARIPDKRIWRTDQHGTITVTTDGTDYNITTENAS
jgi:Predicted hydrolase (metallo-beta-lactamase superfamily)